MFHFFHSFKTEWINLTFHHYDTDGNKTDKYIVEFQVCEVCGKKRLKHDCNKDHYGLKVAKMRWENHGQVHMNQTYNPVTLESYKLTNPEPKESAKIYSIDGGKKDGKE